MLAIQLLVNLFTLPFAEFKEFYASQISCFRLSETLHNQHVFGLPDSL